ncbi:helix-turn-helix transcriptional regulator [Facilibium subflavum]|uniref:helix-turn-helix transcriptional regulator n=1 Tax=Facilibium subflavum TaxID=2219058 RepID=UPI000E6599DC|nr:LuxR C-terminal-related transcriptional regulator [Facilibium subflavum]
MTSIQEIYQHHWKRYQRRFKQLIKYAELPFPVDGLYYLYTDKNNINIEIPLIFHPCFNTYIQTSNLHKNLLKSYSNLIQFPPIITNDYKARLAASYPEKMQVTDSTLYQLPIMLKYNSNNSISTLFIYLNKEYEELGRQYEFSYYINVLHNLIEKAYPTLIHDIKLFTYQNKTPPCFLQHSTHTVEGLPHCKFKTLSKAENRCFIAIYQGNYEAKEIADYLCRSVRTVESVMASMIRKLLVNNRYELFIQIAKAHHHMRYLMTEDL